MMCVFGVVVICLFASFFLIPWPSFEFFSQKLEYSFRLTMEVDVDGETKRGSSVIHVSYADFPTIFGPGVTFGGASVEMTSAPVTRGIEAKPPLMQILRAQRNEPVGPGFVPDVSHFSRGGVT